jgi:dTDP-glucose pyrophosphorylase
MNTTLVILAAGIGSRYGGLKQLESVGPAGETLLEYSIFDALRAGFARVVLVVRPETEVRFRRHLGARLPDGVQLTYVHQTMSPRLDGVVLPADRKKPWGTGHAVLVTQKMIDGPFAVVNADDFYGAGAFAALGRFLTSNRSSTEPAFALAGFRLGPTLSAAGPVTRGLCHVDDGGWLEQIVELPELSIHPSGATYIDDDGVEQLVPGDALVSMNMWGFPPDVFDKLRSRFRLFLAAVEASVDESPEFLIPDAVQGMIADGSARVRVLHHGGQWCGITFPEDRERVREFIAGRVAAGEYPERLWD